jgi:pantetheine-phosphate adenylyltransferase
MNRIAFFPGSFDPFTRGHEDIVRRGLSLFDQVIVGIGTNTNKKRYFEAEYMSAKILETFNNEAVRVVVYDSLTAIEADRQGAKFLLRGLRNTTDFEYENSIAQVNKEIVLGLETVFLITTPALAPISSTIIRDLHKYGTNVDKYLPYKLT